MLALFIGIVSIFGSISSGRYELAIMLPKKDEDAINIFALGLILTSILSLLLFFLVILFDEYFNKFLSNNMGVLLYFVPVAVFFTGIYNLLNYFNVRKEQYKDVANSKIIKSIILVVVQLSIGFMKNGASGLITGQIFSLIFANMRLLKNAIKDKVLISSVKSVKIIALAKKYKNFPKFSMWGGLLNTSSEHLTNILITPFYSVGTLGFYSLVQRLLAMPSALIGSAVGLVFFKQATKEKQQTGMATNTFNVTVKNLVIIGLPSFGIMFFIVEDLFAFMFGEKWRVAGEYAQILTPLYFVRFFVSPMTTMHAISNKNHIGFYWQFGLFALHVGILIYSSSINLSFEHYLYLMSFIVGFYYLLILYIVSSYNKVSNV
ncbi:MAG: oligosaccharide flippase family protein [Bacteroidetes bacterium]|nr:oligosaccharide flippase family protein [Bacteroidota bacterium]